MMLRLAVALFAICALTTAQEKKPEKLAPYYPTPEFVVEKMLKMADLKKGEKLFDLGSGDGRIVIIGAEKFGANSVGVELDPDLWKKSSEKIRTLGLQNLARIIQGDFLVQDYTSADVVTLYLLPATNTLLKPLLEKQLKKGTRVVAHDFEVAGWKSERTMVIDDDSEGGHTLYLYRR